MQTRLSFGTEIAAAVSLAADADRLDALRSVACSLLAIPPRGEPVGLIGIEPIAASPMENLAAAFQRLRNLGLPAPVGELDLVAFARAGEKALVACALAEICHFTPEASHELLASHRPDLTLVVCRTQNFAWSSVKLILGLCQQSPIQLPDENWLCDEYHRMPIPIAQRFCRFLQIHHHRSLKHSRHPPHAKFAEM